ncbi:nucleoside 2-deoxyribosyltransferase [Marinobacterium sp. D7]|uniref:nucleoside 2-deoxyribosyltransferase n=1 Tax=Marinobacterium ramblicola TaxID=2849041 RepID=UPI001C2CF0ED|nr:nucleoside 2-deoxyribosyltransferase [Marinobacterium ramblicola]MBV1788111.1 nucleoside 2-deoxyribosyltransferase [Marinobacterium ramblicola]
MSLKIYLAGPDVFRRDARELGQAKAAICAEYGYEGLFPLDAKVDLSGLSPFQSGMAIYSADIELMNRCDLILANMTPFRGPGLDGGTAFEIGYMRAQGKPVWGYTLDIRDYGDRVDQIMPGWDSEDQQVEAFAMADNLMLVGAIEASGGELLRQSGDPRAMADHLRAFRALIERIASR